MNKKILALLTTATILTTTILTSLPSISAKAADQSIDDFIAESKGYLTNASVTESKDGNNYGRPIISDPTSLIYLSSNNGSGKFFDKLGAKGAYSSEVGGNYYDVLESEYLDIGYYPYISNPSSPGGSFSLGWKITDKGYPTNIMNLTYSRVGLDGTTQQKINAEAWTHSDTLYIKSATENINDLKVALKLSNSLDTSNGSASWDESAKIITAKDNVSGQYISMGMTGVDMHQVSSTTVDATSTLNSSLNSTTNSETYLGLGRDGILSEDQTTVMAISLGINEQTTKDKVSSGLSNWSTSYNDAIADCNNYFNGIEQGCYKQMSAKEYSKLLMNLQQIRSQMYGNYLSSGTGSWHNDFIRDSSYTAKALAKVPHAQTRMMAQDIMRFFTEVDTLENANSYTVDKKKRPESMNMTDSSAAMLMAMAALRNIHTPIPNEATMEDAVLKYVNDNFNEADGHIVAKHAHDYWDDYVGSSLNVNGAKYESYIDVVWIKALEDYIASSQYDTPTTLKCKTIATTLRANLNDYKGSNTNLMSYGLDYTLVPYGIDTLPSTLANAWLLKDTTSQTMLTGNTKASLTPTNTHYNLLFNAPENAAQRSNVWCTNLYEMSSLLSSKNDNTLKNLILDSFELGGMPEYIKFDTETKLGFASHAQSFVWGMGDWIETLFYGSTFNGIDQNGNIEVKYTVDPYLQVTLLDSLVDFGNLNYLTAKTANDTINFKVESNMNYSISLLSNIGIENLGTQTTKKSTVGVKLDSFDKEHEIGNGRESLLLSNENMNIENHQLHFDVTLASKESNGDYKGNVTLKVSQVPTNNSL